MQLEDACTYERVCIFKKRIFTWQRWHRIVAWGAYYILTQDYDGTQQTTLVYEKSPVAQRQNYFFEVTTKRKKEKIRTNKSWLTFNSDGEEDVGSILRWWSVEAVFAQSAMVLSSIFLIQRCNSELSFDVVDFFTIEAAQGPWPNILRHYLCGLAENVMPFFKRAASEIKGFTIHSNIVGPWFS